MFTLFQYCRPWAFAASFSALLAVAGGCDQDRPEVGPGDVRTLRILGVRSEPADPVPGQRATLRALVMNHEPDELALIWAAVDPQSVLASEGAGRGEFDPAIVSFAGLVTPPVILPMLSQPGYPLLATAAYFPATFAADVTSAAVVVLAHAGPINIGRALDRVTQREYLQELFDESIVGLKILRLNDPVPNANPNLRGLAPHRIVLKINESTKRPEKTRTGDRWDVPRGGMIEMGADVEDESPLCETGESKDYGTRGVSCVSFGWYAANGLLRGFVRSTEIWEAPQLAGIYTLAVVARDRIGGLDWVLQDVNVGRPVEAGSAGRVLLRSDVGETGGITKASRLLWIPLGDAAAAEKLRGYAASKEAFAARLAMFPDTNERLHLNIDPASFALEPAAATPVSLQAASERLLSGEVNIRFVVEVLE